mmetsp:Transcript_10908/g.8104  ORF Transcript_10908/g.8104 Transcript_10908/m.8104 type:complete len:82 (-) Transcript_10908:765-1010(-)
MAYQLNEAERSERIEIKEISEPKKEINSGNFYLFQQVLASAFVNSVRTAFGYPLDTIKVKLQVENYKKLTMTKCFQDLVFY